MMPVKIFSAFHKPSVTPPVEWVTPIQVGTEYGAEIFCPIQDNQGDDYISEKNGSFCELTALYWIWKNLDKIDAQYIGLAHYRRYLFVPSAVKDVSVSLNLLVRWKKTKSEYRFSFNQINSFFTPSAYQRIVDMLERYPLILPKPTEMNVEGKTANVMMQFNHCHSVQDWQILRDEIMSGYPSWMDSFTQLSNQNSISTCNMFIANKSFIRDYCEWLFPLLFGLEHKVKLELNHYQRRLFGFYAERLLNLYVIQHKMTPHYLPVVFFEC
jgi:hypothetical protein